ncbi:MAG: putative sulfate transporter [Calditrichaeota bacterium]|nr:putative sulfate transporter [Calditrichota bacterium]
MALVNARTNNSGNRGTPGSFLLRLFPFLTWFRGYTFATLRVDFISGLTVALVLVPQSMAYAQLADLPAYYGLYAAFLPPVIAALWGSSNQLATGPVAIVSLMTSTALAPLATAGSENFIIYAILLAFVVGLFQFFLGVFRLGMVVNFLSHPVVNGFTNAAAIIIATSQLSKLFGVDVDKAEHHYETVARVVEAAVDHTHWPTFALAALAFAIMIVLRRVDRRIPNVLIAVVVTTLISWATGFEQNRTVPVSRIDSESVRETIVEYNTTLAEVDSVMAERIAISSEIRAAEADYGANSIEVIELHSQQGKCDVMVQRLRERAGELRSELRDFRFVQPGGGSPFLPVSEIGPERASGLERWKLKVGGRALAANELTLMGGGAVVGVIPRGLPQITVPHIQLSIALELLPMAIVISLLGFMEAISIAKAMAARTGQRLDPNQELIGQGLANIVGAFGQSYPVSGSFSRSAVNLQAGAATGVSNAFSSLIVMITLLFFTPMLYHLPQSVLAAIIMMAVIGLVNVSGFVHAWKAQRYDGVISVLTFVLTLAFAPHLDRGIMIGVVLSLALYLLRNMTPQTAILSKTPDGHYRNADRWRLEVCRHVGLLRFNNSLIFANVNYLEDRVLDVIRRLPELKHLVIVGNGMNELDASGEVALSKLVTQLRENGVDVSFSGLNDHVIDVMKRTHLYDKIGDDHFYFSLAQAVHVIHDGTCIEDETKACPLLVARFKAFEVAEETVREHKAQEPWYHEEEERGSEKQSRRERSEGE